MAIVYLDEHQDAKKTKEAVEAYGRRCLTIAGDISGEPFCQEAVEKTVNDLGRLDILVSNAAEQYLEEDDCISSFWGCLLHVRGGHAPQRRRGRRCLI